MVLWRIEAYKAKLDYLWRATIPWYVVSLHNASQQIVVLHKMRWSTIIVRFESQFGRVPDEKDARYLGKTHIKYLNT